MYPTQISLKVGSVFGTVGLATVRAYLTVAIAIWFSSSSSGQDKRRVEGGVYLREGFSSSAQRVNPRVNYNGHSEMATGVGLFLLIPMPRDSTGIPLRYRPKVWKSHHVKVEAGLAQRSGLFYLMPGEAFQITAGVLDVSLIVPLYFKASEGVHGYFGSGVDGSYYMSMSVTPNGATTPPNIQKPNLSIGFVLDSGLLIGKPDNPAMIISSRFYDQLRGKYRFKEFAFTISVTMWRKFRGR